MTTRGRIRVTTRNGDARRMWDARRPFVTSGAMHGDWMRVGSTTGRLPDEYRRQLWDDFKRFGPHGVFVVWSYGTPIAWRTPNGDTFPAVKYSVTTSRHQGQLR